MITNQNQNDLKLYENSSETTTTIWVGAHPVAISRSYFDGRMNRRTRLKSLVKSNESIICLYGM